jgi:hypothetical protein
MKMEAEGFSVPVEKMGPTDGSVEIKKRENKILDAEKSVADQLKKRFAEIFIGQSFETERSL